MKTGAELRFGFWDVTARGDATLTASGNQPFADVKDMNGEEPLTLPPVATLEPNFGWPLDGSRTLLSARPQDTRWGWWSRDLSGSGGAFGNPPALTVSFAKPHSSLGITLAFQNALPGHISVVWYDPIGAVLADRDFRPKDFTFFCDCQVEGYTKIIVKVWSMSEPGRYLHVTHIIFGALEVLDGKRLQSATVCEEVDPSALTLPIGTLEACFCSADGRFSLLDPSGAYRLFQRKQPIEIYRYLEDTKEYLGVYYLSEAEGTVDSVTRLACETILGVLDTIKHKGGIYQTVPVQVLLDEILGTEGIPYTLSPSLAGERLTGYLPYKSKRYALQQIAFAIGALIDPYRQEGVAIYPKPMGVAQRIGYGRKVIGHTVKQDDIVTRVDVTVHSYRLENTVQELVKIELPVGLHTLELATPSEVSAVSGATLVESGHNYATVEVMAAGEVILTGKTYTDDTTVYTAALPNQQTDLGITKTVAEATLVDHGRVGEVAKRLLAHYQDRYVDEGTLLPGDEKTALRTEINSLGGVTLAGAITRMSIDLTGGQLERICLRGAPKGGA